MHKVLFLDDEPHLVAPFKRSLSTVFEVVFFDRIDEAEAYLLENLDVLGFVVDVMLPQGVAVPPMQDIAGVMFIRRLEQYIVASGLPVFFLSNKSEDVIRESIAGFPPQLLSLMRSYHKPNTTPEELTTALKSKVDRVVARERMGG